MLNEVDGPVSLRIRGGFGIGHVERGSRGVENPKMVTLSLIVDLAYFVGNEYTFEGDLRRALSNLRTPGLDPNDDAK